MVRHVHFCNVGLKPEPPLAVCLTEYPKDMVYLVNSPPDPDSDYTKNENEVRSRLESVGIKSIGSVYVDPYDMDSVIEKVERVIDSEIAVHGDCRFHFNITAGTNISACAMSIVAMSTPGSDIYHLREGKYCNPPNREGKLIYVQLADMSSVEMLESSPKEASIMENIGASTVPHREVVAKSGMTPSLLSYHLKKLTEAGLIERVENNVRQPEWRMTDKGTKAFARYSIRKKTGI